MEAQRDQGASQHGMASLGYGQSPQHQPSPWPPSLLHFSSLMGRQPREVTWAAASIPAAPLPPLEASSYLCLADPDPGLRRGATGSPFMVNSLGPSWSCAAAPGLELISSFINPVCSSWRLAPSLCAPRPGYVAGGLHADAIV